MSHTLAEEGAAILSFKLVKGGKFQVACAEEEQKVEMSHELFLL